MGICGWPRPISNRSGSASGRSTAAWSAPSTAPRSTAEAAGSIPWTRRRFYYHGMEFQLDWRRGVDRLVRVFFRPGPGELGLPDGFGVDGQPEMPLYRTTASGVRRYFTNCYNSNPTNGASVVMLWLDRPTGAVPGGRPGPRQRLEPAEDRGLQTAAARRSGTPQRLAGPRICCSPGRTATATARCSRRK